MARGRVLVAFVDALGPTQLDRLKERIHALEHRRDLEGILGYSSGALASVLTGAAPAEHGRMCLFTAREDDAPSILRPLRWLGLFPRLVHERGRIRRLAARVVTRTAGLSGYVALHRVPPEEFHWLDLPEREDLFAAEEVGGVSTFLADARAAGLTVYAAPWQLPEAERWAHAHDAIRRLRPDLAFLYAAELDAALHEGGAEGGRSDDVLDRIALHLDRAREEMAEGGGDVTTIIVGDHGMADVHRCIDPRPVVSNAGARVFVDSTMLRLWGDARALDATRREVERVEWPGVWLDRDALRARRAPTERDPYGAAIFVLDEGVIFAPSYVGGRVRGMHGYDVSSTSARAALASDQPIPSECASITDVAPLVRRGLELT